MYQKCLYDSSITEANRLNYNRVRVNDQRCYEFAYHTRFLYKLIKISVLEELLKLLHSFLALKSFRLQSKVSKGFIHPNLLNKRALAYITHVENKI